MTFEKWWDKQIAEGNAPIQTTAGIKRLRDCWEAATLAEREACARVCDKRAASVERTVYGDYQDGWNDGSAQCAAAIRAR